MEVDPIRVLVADDHPIVRGGLVALLDTLDGVEVVAQAADGAAAVREAVLSRPDVVILDLRMPHLDGVQAARRMAVEVPETAVLVLTMFDEDELIADALAAGARGYLLKGAEPEEIERAVRAVAAGGAIFSADVASRVLGRSRASEPAPAFPQLTAREREVLDLIARGISNAAIATRLGIAAKTIGNHISAIFLKLGVASRPEAIVLARESGFGA
ncbi:response regulator [Naasia lichenicola]|uniref:Response regulator transcription factor n=1 Tax=Naasia lichenicola TaxID=2565933 RepID=A0A4S4FEZ0_9MICO|nr:response regulator transcription factor [Naasia lichenicola]THG28538.1 response regulator transcription factor [Naasia lichenicola]